MILIIELWILRSNQHVFMFVMVIIKMIRIRLKEDSYFTPSYLGAVTEYEV